MKNKKMKYIKLVTERKMCNLCLPNFINPIAVNKKYDCDEIGTWTSWQNSLDADIMLIGQDWGTIKEFNNQKGMDYDEATNKNLVELFNSIGIKVFPPSSRIKNNRLFFTNQILCLKKEKNIDLEKSCNWKCCRKCGDKFLKPLVDFIQPKIIITLGRIAFKNLMESYKDEIKKDFDVNVSEITKETYGDLVGQSIPLNYESVIIPVYHCSPKQIGRNMKQQIQDWQVLINYI